ncbi:hypothetical protein GT045_02340 [Streptomyces sp. SID486]|uniref:hypothetical protein n=1 Tax=unclassified Streptomyces TaxID=2593676 RepID=UPI00136B4655|nr:MULTISPECIES: hypothetical protein [unclassified Streptomyces]MYW41846.1 hypothetical protein [Streptomyces sp. SID161]MYX93676.1 hypothetical protein [Streptomyces sp. SID486]
MARTPQPRHITLGGREAVALTREEYDQLIASRRQIGGQSARVRVLAQQAKRTEQLLHDLEALIASQGEDCTGRAHTSSAPCAESTSAQTGSCLRCELAALLRRHRDPAS